MYMGGAGSIKANVVGMDSQAIGEKRWCCAVYK